MNDQQLVLTLTDPLPPELWERIADARRGAMSDCAADVLDLLTEHPSGPRTGRANALSIAQMQRLWSAAGETILSRGTVSEMKAV